MIKFYTLISTLLLSNIILGQDSAKVLFIGNSYTYFNNLPGMLTDLSTSLGDYVQPTSQVAGGATFQVHATNPATYTAINSADWDFVVLQAQSQEPSFPDSQVNSETLPFAEQMADSIRNNSICSNILMFMTWGRENGDPQWVPISTFDGMNSRLRNAYIRMADSIDASISPVGVAWKYVRDNYPSIQLYSPDGSHPSLEGSYLAACTFYASLFRKSPVGASFTSSLAPATAANLQLSAAAAVMDSLDHWNLYPMSEHTQADFSYEVNGGEVVFINNSVNATAYDWNFNDGQVSNDESPVIVYSAPGSYSVTLVSSSPCDSDTLSSTIVIGSNSIVTNLPKDLMIRQMENGIFQIYGDQEFDQIVVTDATGRIVTEQREAHIDLSNKPTGLYLIRIQSEDRMYQVRIYR
jgi:hypothetical protein